jgi:hypothetical protein
MFNDFPPSGRRANEHLGAGILLVVICCPGAVLATSTVIPLASVSLPGRTLVLSR